MIVEPPSLDGALNATERVVLPAVMEEIVGAVGITPETVSVKEEVAAVPKYGESVAVTTIAEFPGTVGVPEITPVDELRANPLGRVPVVTANDLVPAPPEALRLSVNDVFQVADKPVFGVVILI